MEKCGLRLKEELDYDVVNTDFDHRYRDFWQTYHRMTERKGVTAQMAKIEMRRRLTLIGSMLLYKDQVDGMICGTWGTTTMHLHYIDQVIGRRAGTSCVTFVSPPAGLGTATPTFMLANCGRDFEMGSSSEMSPSSTSVSSRAG